MTDQNSDGTERDFGGLRPQIAGRAFTDEDLSNKCASCERPIATDGECSVDTGTDQNDPNPDAGGGS